MPQDLATAPTPITRHAAALLQHLWREAEALPPAVVARAQRLWLDTVSCACSGLTAEEPRRWLALQARAEPGPVPLPGAPEHLGASAASMALALGACWDEACEGLALAHGRPGIPIVAALWSELALAPHSWQRLWQATAVGYEVAARLGAQFRIGPGLHVDGVWGALGAAVALVHFRGGSVTQALAALEAAATQLPFTLVRPVRQGATVRNLYLAHSTALARQSADAVAAGFGTPRGALDDVATLMLAGAPAGQWHAAGPWLLLQSYWKPYAAVRHVHYGARCAADWFALGQPSTAIESLTLQVYPEAWHYCSNRAPHTALAAQFSLSFGVAAMLRFGDLSPAEFRAPRFQDAELRRLEALLQVEVDATRYPPPQRGARLVLVAAGQRFEADHQQVVGDPGNEPDEAAVQRKFEQFTASDMALARWARCVREDAPHLQASLPHSLPNG